MKFKLTEAQFKKLQQGSKNNTAVTLTLGPKDVSSVGVSIKVDKSIFKDGKKHRITVAPPVMKNGGFLPLIPLIAGLLTLTGGAAGAAAGIASTVKNSREAANAKTEGEIKKVQLEKLKNELAKAAATPIAATVPAAAAAAAGSGLYIRPYSSGNGVHLYPPGFRANCGNGLKKKKKY